MLVTDSTDKIVYIERTWKLCWQGCSTPGFILLLMRNVRLIYQLTCPGVTKLLNGNGIYSKLYFFPVYHIISTSVSTLMTLFLVKSTKGVWIGGESFGMRKKKKSTNTRYELGKIIQSQRQLIISSHLENHNTKPGHQRTKSEWAQERRYVMLGMNIDSIFESIDSTFTGFFGFNIRIQAEGLQWGGNNHTETFIRCMGSVVWNLKGLNCETVCLSSWTGTVRRSERKL